MNDELDEAVSAWIDGEVPPAAVLRRALARPGALALVDGLLAVRELLQTSAEPRAEAVAATVAAMAQTRRHRRYLAPQLRWMLAAVVLLAVGTAIGAALGRGDGAARDDASRPPAADLIANFSFDSETPR